MAVWKIVIRGKNIRRDTVEKIVEKALRDKYGKEASIQITDDSPPESRSDRFSKALNQVSEARSEIENLREELEEWRDEMPENLQNGSKAEEIDEAISSLEDVISNLEDLENSEVSFPGQR